jgi:hypothetical protein
MSSNTVRASASPHFARRLDHPYLLGCFPERIYCQKSEHNAFARKSALTPPTACSRSGFVISKAIPAPLPELAWMRKTCSDAAQPAPLRPPQESSMWNESLRARPPCNHYLAIVQRSARAIQIPVFIRQRDTRTL